MRYLKDHWHGRHSLARAFFINALPLFCVLWWLLDPLVALFEDDARRAYLLTAIYAAVAFFVILPWQVMGVLRSSERYLVDYGNPVYGRAAQAGAVVAILAAVIAVVGAVQRIGARQNYLEFSRKWEEVTTRAYDLTRIEGTRLARLRGDMQNGTTRVLEEWLANQPDIEGIVLDSTGGRVYEGRGVARVITERGLDTYTMEGCYSACTTAFIAGSRRYLVENAKLGFHQYKYDSVKNLGYLNSDAEQEKDRAWYRGKNIDERFLERIFDKPDTDMWYPDPALLLEYRVIHAVVERDRLKGASG